MAKAIGAERPRGIVIFYLFSFLEGFVPVYPVYLIMFADRGMGFREISLLISIWSVPVVLLELPTGMLADRFGKRPAIVAGMALKAACFAVWAASDSFFAAAAGFVLWACQEALCSGAFQALLYEALERESVEESYDKIAGNSRAYGMAGMASAMAIGGFLYSASPALTLVASSLSTLAGAVAACRFAEGTAGKESPGGAGAEGIVESLRATRSALSGKGVAALVAAACAAGGMYGLVDEYDGMWAMEAYGVPVAWAGVWSAGRFGIEAVGGMLAPVFRNIVRGARGLAITVAFAGACMVAAAFAGKAGIPAYACYYALMAALAVVFEARLQGKCDPDHRAVTLSAYNLAMTLFAIAASPLLGIAMGWGGLRAGLSAAGIATIAAAGCLAAGGGRSRRRI